VLAEQFTAAAAAARNTHAVDEVARLTWRAHAERQLSDAEAEAIGAALQARRKMFGQGGVNVESSRKSTLRVCLRSGMGFRYRSR
jgi:hypothetical protein